eukprot:gnl/Spiro4/21195_TR10345_c0_g1_i1.p1 gnl/Spiro4/21195_TR10345_c0_g1~~gnl/Spiro4/21195_TR10345_c0_g1_i1.p1  ORF type:complete len:466 (+),score=158.03 gnl/Spiro4/21195_TR10345_c0_g1_i1:50-1399(+)
MANRRNNPEPTQAEKDAKLVVQLTEQNLQLQAKLSQEISDRNYFQLERDKINSFWEITKQELEDLKAEGRNKQREIEEMEESHQVEIKVFKQRIKHLLYDHQNKVTDVKHESEVAHKELEDVNRAKEAQLRTEHRMLKVKLKDNELCADDTIRNLKQEYDRHVTQLRLNAQQEMNELRTTMERRMKALKDDLDMQRKQEIHQIEERKNAHLIKIIKDHEHAFTQIRSFYNDMTRHNIDSINHHKDEIADLKRQQEASKKTEEQLKRKNLSLTKPLADSQRKVAQLELKLANYEKDKISLAAAKARVADLEKQLKKVSWEYEVLEQRFERTLAEHNDLKDKFESRLYQVHQRSGLKNILLEKKCEQLVGNLQQKEQLLNEVLVRFDLDPAVISHIAAHLDDVLAEKNNTIRDLQLALARVAKSRNDMLRVLESRLSEIGINVREFGIEPV